MTNAIFRGIINIRYSNSISLSSHPAAPGCISVYRSCCTSCQPGILTNLPKKISSFHRNSRRARCVAQLTRTAENWEIYVRGVWSLSSGPSGAPGHELSTGYPQFIHKGVWGSLNPPNLWFNCLVL